MLPSKLCLVALFAWLLSAPVSAEPIQVFILAGQSNMVGSGDPSLLPTEPVNLQQPQADIPYSYDLRQDPFIPDITEEWITLGPRVSSFGSEVTFGSNINAALTEPIAVIKHAYSGTSLYGDWNPAAPAEFRQIYPVFLSHVQTRLAELGVAGVDYELAGMMWHQGESDLGNAVVGDYAEMLTAFVAQVRADLGAPALPFFIGAISENNGHVNAPIIRAEQQYAAQIDPNAYYVETSHLPLKVDFVHFTTEGQIGLGEAFASAYLSRLEGDVNGDGYVGIEDLNAVLGSWNATVTGPSLADPTGDGFVGINDLNLVLGNWNNGTPPVVDSVPEPAAFTLVLLGGWLCCRR